MEKYILQHGQIHLAMWTNTFCNVDKWIVWFGQIQLLINCTEKGTPERERTKCRFQQISWIFCDQVETNFDWNIKRFIKGF